MHEQLTLGHEDLSSRANLQRRSLRKKVVPVAPNGGAVLKHGNNRHLKQNGSAMRQFPLAATCTAVRPVVYAARGVHGAPPGTP